MKFKDKKAKRWLKNAESYALYEYVETLPESERDDRDDIQILADEVSYLLSLYNDDTTFSEDYLEAEEFLKETSNGTVMVYWDNAAQIPKYTKTQMEIKYQDSMNIINEYKRLVRLMKLINKNGYYGEWQ